MYNEQIARLVGIEGSSFAGKTTLTHRLHERYGLPRIPEVMECLDLFGIKRPHFPPQTEI